MARILDQLPPLGGIDTARYPWNDWTDRRVWEIKHGEDFDCQPGTMQARLHKIAQSRGLRVSTRLNKSAKTIAFQFRGLV